MPTKIFTILGGNCPFGRGVEIDSAKCRECSNYYRAGTGTFFWCKHPAKPKPKAEAPKAVPKAQEAPQEKRKRGRPPGKAAKKPVKRTKTKK